MEEDNPMPLIVFLLSIIKTTPYKSKFVFSPSQCLNTIYNLQGHHFHWKDTYLCAYVLTNKIPWYIDCYSHQSQLLNYQVSWLGAKEYCECHWNYYISLGYVHIFLFQIIMDQWTGGRCYENTSFMLHFKRCNFVN